MICVNYASKFLVKWILHSKLACKVRHIYDERMNGSPMKGIDIHAHYIPQMMIDRIRQQADLFPYVTIEDVPGTIRMKIGNASWTRPINQKLFDLDERAEELKRQDIYMQINAGWLDIFGYQLPAGQGVEWSNFLNDALLEATQSARGDIQYKTLATVPLQDGEAAAQVLKKAKESGHLGVMIGTWIPSEDGTTGMDLDHPSLDPFWQAAQDLDFPVYIHPVFAGAQPRAKDWAMVNAVARPGETAISVARLLYAGVPLRFPGLKLIISHGGGSLPIALGRMQRNYDFLKQKGEQICDPTEGFKKLYFDSILFEPEALRFLLSLTSTDRVMMGSDAPFPIRDPKQRDIIDSVKLGLSDETKHAILAENAIRLFKM